MLLNEHPQKLVKGLYKVLDKPFHLQPIKPDFFYFRIIQKTEMQSAARSRLGDTWKSKLITGI